MAKPKYDIVVKAVRYDHDGRILCVQAFKRVGFVWTDLVLINRQDLIEQLRSGKQVVTGHRIPFYGANFETASQVKLVSVDSQEVIVSGDVQAQGDRLQGVPIF